MHSCGMACRNCLGHADPSAFKNSPINNLSVCFCDGTDSPVVVCIHNKSILAFKALTPRLFTVMSNTAPNWLYKKLSAKAPAEPHRQHLSLDGFRAVALETGCHRGLVVMWLSRSGWDVTLSRKQYPKPCTEPLPSPCLTFSALFAVVDDIGCSFYISGTHQAQRRGIRRSLRVVVSKICEDMLFLRL